MNDENRVCYLLLSETVYQRNCVTKKRFAPKAKALEKEGRRGNKRDSIDIYERENRLYFMNYLLGGNTHVNKKLTTAQG